MANDEEEITEYLDEGVNIAKGLVTNQLAHVLGENPDRWFGAGVLATWLMESLEDNFEKDEEEKAVVLTLAMLMRGFLNHPLALASLERWKKENP